MSDDLNNKIKQLTDILGQENLQDNIKELLSSLTNPSNGSGNSNSNTSRENNSADMSGANIEGSINRKENQGFRNDSLDSSDMLRKFGRIVEKLKTASDPRINLLNAVRPFLNNTRQSKLSQCIKFLQMANIAKLMDENDKNIL